MKHCTPTLAKPTAGGLLQESRDSLHRLHPSPYGFFICLLPERGRTLDAGLRGVWRAGDSMVRGVHRTRRLGNYSGRRRAESNQRSPCARAPARGRKPRARRGAKVHAKEHEILERACTGRP